MSHPDPAVEHLVQRQAVHDLVNRYAAGVDRRDMALVASCFAPDVDASAWSGHTGREELIDYISGVAVFHTTMHMMGNRFIEIDGDAASVISHATLTHHGHHPDGTVWVLNGTDRRYAEELRRVAGGWVIVRRGGPSRYDRPGVMGLTSEDPDVRWLLDRAAIYDLLARRALALDPTPATEHFLGTPLAVIDGDEASVTTTVLRTDRATGPDGSEESTSVLVWHDALVRDRGGWRPAGASDAPIVLPRARRSPDPVVQGLLDRASIVDVIAAFVLGADRDEDHVLNNHIIEVDGDTATADTYAYVVGDRPWFEGARRLVDRLVRTDDGWRVVERRVLDNRIRD